MRTIAIVNFKGGVGKTTTAINLAASLAFRGRPALLVDLDPQAHATLGIRGPAAAPERTVFDALLYGTGLEEVVMKVGPNLDLAPAAPTPGEPPAIPTGELLGGGGIGEQLAAVAARYEYAVIDCPPSAGEWSRAAVLAADEVIVPVETSFFALNGVAQLLDTVRELERLRGRSVPVRALATMFDARTRFAREVLENLEEFFGTGLFQTVIRVNVKLREATSFGVPVVEYARRSRGAEDYLALADEVIEAGVREETVLEEDLVAIGQVEEGQGR